MTRISWSARSRGGHKSASKYEENKHVWLRGWPKTACGRKISYIRGDDEWFTGDPKESGCPKCCNVVGYKDRIAIWQKVEFKGPPLRKLDEKSERRKQYRSRQRAGLCVQCLTPTEGYVRCAECRRRHVR